MEKITYLFGAGASANVLPVIKEGRPGVTGLATMMEDFVGRNKEEILEKSRWTEKDFIQLIEVVRRCKVFGTPDLAAKNYLERGDLDNYRLLKLLLSTYFLDVQQARNTTGAGFEGQNLDPRVVSFFTTISQKGKIPKNVKALSWNYDKQIEMGADLLTPVDGDGNDFSLNFHVWPFNAPDVYWEDKDYFLVHLNGVAGYIYSDHHLAMANFKRFDFTNKQETLLSFAWEDEARFRKEKFTAKRIELAKKLSAGTTILVIIGYSFPFFNIKIDAELFLGFKKTLKKIYFQDPYLDGQFLFNQFGLLKENPNIIDNPEGRIVHIAHIKDTSQYYVPFEL